MKTALVHSITLILTVLCTISFSIQTLAQGEASVVGSGGIEVIAEGFQFTEGPYWIGDGVLVFSDIPANKVYRWKEGEGHEVYLDPSGRSNGITADAKGHLVLAQHSRKVSRYEDGLFYMLVDKYEGKKLNSPNDLVIDSKGRLYFTDPPFGIEEDQKELDFNGVYLLDTYDELHLLVDDFNRPNGIVLSPDEQTLYVNDSYEGHIRAFDLDADGLISNGRLFAEMDDPTAEGVPDGMKVDTAGNIYSTGPGGVWIFTPEGELLDRIETPDRVTNLAWGGAKLDWLYMTAPNEVYRHKMNTQGIQQQ